jgi:general secretion pathway protein J
MMDRSSQRGFTLLEILIASVIMVIMSVLAYRTVAAARADVEMSESHLDRLRDVQKAVHLMVTDFRTASNRPVREMLGDGHRASLLRDANSINLVELSHGGWPNGAGSPRGTVQRVLYRLEDRMLIREHWNVTDPTLANLPVKRELLKDVESVEIRYLDNGREWVSEWPPLGSAAAPGFSIRPMAVEIVITLTDYGKLRRLVEVPG